MATLFQTVRTQLDAALTLGALYEMYRRGDINARWARAVTGVAVRR